MQPLVQQAVAVAVPPDDLQAVLPLVDEAEHRASLRVLVEHLASRQREPIEGATHVLRMVADEDRRALGLKDSLADALRVHFDVVTETKDDEDVVRIVVGHCGGHLNFK